MRFTREIFAVSPPIQILIVDGQELRQNPATIMENIQKFLGITPLFNYTQALK